MYKFVQNGLTNGGADAALEGTLDVGLKGAPWCTVLHLKEQFIVHFKSNWKGARRFEKRMDLTLHLLLRIPPYSVRMRENVDQNNSEYGHFLRSAE